MPLSKEDLQRIEEEERARLEIRRQLESAPPSAPQVPPGAANQPEHVDPDLKIGKWVVGVFFVVVALALLNYWQGPGFSAKRAAQQFVESRLKAPGTAKFPSYSEFTATKSGEATWIVSGYVDAENGFGAMLRSKWWVMLSKEDGRWVEDIVRISPVE